MSAPDDLAVAEPPVDYETAVRADDRLELRLWLRLLTCSNTIERELRRALRERFDTTLPRFDVLAQLDRAPEGLTLSELSRRLMVSNGNVTGLISGLVQEGLVESRRAASDGRSQIVRLTPEGKQAFDRMTPEHERWVATLFQGLGRAEMAGLHELLGRLKRSLP